MKKVKLKGESGGHKKPYRHGCQGSMVRVRFESYDIRLLTTKTHQNCDSYIYYNSNYTSRMTERLNERERVSVCACVCVRERERERKKEWERERERERDTMASLFLSSWQRLCLGTWLVTIEGDLVNNKESKLSVMINFNNKHGNILIWISASQNRFLRSFLCLKEFCRTPHHCMTPRSVNRQVLVMRKRGYEEAWLWGSVVMRKRVMKKRNASTKQKNKKYINKNKIKLS